MWFEQNCDIVGPKQILEEVIYMIVTKKDLHFSSKKKDISKESERGSEIVVRCLTAKYRFTYFIFGY